MKQNSSKQASEEKNRNLMTGTCVPPTPGGEIQNESTGIDTASARIANARRSSSKRRKTKSSDSDISSVGPSRKRRHGEDEKSTVTNLAETSASQTLASSEDKCSFCFSVTNRQGSTEDFLVCKDCNAKIHPSCMDLTEELARRASRSPWQCIECKTCNICNDAGDPEEMLFCDACDKGYHMNCHSPPVPEKPTGKWVCCRCTAELEACDTVEAPTSIPAGLAVNTENGNSGNNDAAGITGLPTPRDSPVHFTSAETLSKEVMSTKIEDTAVILPKLSVTMVGEPPDASGWSVTEVVNFFTDIGFVEQAKIFQQEEIDGKALLLMTRNDVLTGMSFRLGPALKIYAHVKRLQSRDFAFLNYS